MPVTAAPRRLAGRAVFPIGLGAMNLSWTGSPARAESVRVIAAAIDAGMELVDTADVYAPSADEIGHNELLVAEATRGRDVVIATKGGVRRAGDQWRHDGRPEHLRAACEASLGRLGRIDLYYLHAVDAGVPIEESVGTLARLRDEGKIGAIGISNVDPGQLDRALHEAPIAAVQNEVSPFRPEGLTDGVLAACEARSIAFVAHSPMGGWRAGETAHLPILRELAEELGVTPFAVVIGWLLAASERLLVIPGASRIANARASAEAAGLLLDPDRSVRISRGLASA
jgi:aryl-alcohol dehydrogenase-like predicted oxidoreductase